MSYIVLVAKKAITINSISVSAGGWLSILDAQASKHQLDIGRQRLWEHYDKIYLKNFATSPCYHVVITYACLGACLCYVMLCGIYLPSVVYNFLMIVQ